MSNVPEAVAKPRPHTYENRCGADRGAAAMLRSLHRYSVRWTVRTAGQRHSTNLESSDHHSLA
jgi:hypothetical protein